VGGHAYGAVYSGPIGAALDPALEGIAVAHHLPNASTFCGRCDSVCPVKIPLTRIMRHWRGVEFSQGISPPEARFGLKLWACLAKKPRLYQFATSIAAYVLRAAAKNGTLSSLPVFRGWFAMRDLPRPAAESFQARWRKGERA
jgi:L-lactate dehydrogenase complex protein LldF